MKGKNLLSDPIPRYDRVRLAVKAKLLNDGKLRTRPAPPPPVNTRELLTVRDVNEFALEHTVGGIGHVLQGLTYGETRSATGGVDPIDLPWFAFLKARQLEKLRDMLRPLIDYEVFVDTHPLTKEVIVRVKMSSKLSKKAQDVLRDKGYLPWITGHGEFYVALT